MAKTPWRFQADVPAGVTDPDVTVFMGDTYTNDATGEKTVRQDTSNPATVKLSQLPAALTNPDLLKQPKAVP